MTSDSDILKIYKNIRKKKLISFSLMIWLIFFLIIAYTVENRRSLKDNDLTILPYYGEVKDFSLTNTRNERYAFSQDNGKIRLVNFFYTECPGDDGCSLVSLKLSRLFSEIRQNDYLKEIRFVSISFDYINDTIEDLVKYAGRYTNDTENWQFLSGNQTEIERVTDDWGFYFEQTANISDQINLNHHPSGEPDPYDHSFVVYLIDENNIIRKFLLGNFWLIDDAFESIEYLISEM